MKSLADMWEFGKQRFKSSVSLVVLIGMLSISLFLCVFIRTANLQSLEETYLLGTDSYRFLRQADLIVSQGHLPEVDTQRWQLEGRDLSTSLTFFPMSLPTPIVFCIGFFRT